MMRQPPITDWQFATWKVYQALHDSFTSRQEIAELAAAAYGGPLQFAERLRQTEFGSREVDPAWTAEDFVAFIFGEDACFGDEYSSALLYQWQSLAPYVATTH